ncbi:hypothetical protein [Streptomyces sp. NEAU-H3]|uniref:hypothetical protein n=1 Tax=Streptomyces sp. NEAU-H3 TaxID=2720636 RepID=UPI00143C1DCB|nr:hypothetical protein [Streptomyces sp. NEAU-H3]NJA56680.1 hypothetical protein [Streptomyces sp. NEAU-H3]
MSGPLFLLDVDGPLNPYAANPSRRPKGYTTHRMRPTGWEHPRQKPLRVWLNPSHGPALLNLPGGLIWATAWGAEANTWIGPHLGLPALPVIVWPETGPRIGALGAPTLHWKTIAVVEYAAGRPFAWIDDEITDADREYVAVHHVGPALLHHVSSHLGLLPADFEELTRWGLSVNTKEAR